MDSQQNELPDAHRKATRFKQRKHERLGGGWFVFGRSGKDGRIHPTPVPFEHPTLAAAEAEAQRLAEKYPNRTFHVCGIVATARTVAPSADQYSEIPERRACHSRNAAYPDAAFSSSQGRVGVNDGGGRHG